MRTKIIFVVFALVALTALINSYGSYNSVTYGFGHLLSNFSTTDTHFGSHGMSYNGTHIISTDPNNNSAYLYYVNGTYTGWHFNFTGVNEQAEGITQNATHYFVSDAIDNAVYFYYKNGTYTGQFFGVVGNARGMSINEDVSPQVIYVASSGNQIGKYQVDGTSLATCSVSIPGASPGIDLFGVDFRNESGTIYHWVSHLQDEHLYKIYENCTYAGYNGTIGENYTETVYPHEVASNETHVIVNDPAVDHIMFFLFNLTTPDYSDPEITLTSPANGASLTSGTVQFNATVTDNIAIANVTLYIDGVLNETNTSGVNGTYSFSKILSDGSHNWSIQSYDNDSNLSTSATRTFSIDTSVSDPLKVGLVSYYKLDEASGVVIDSKGSNNGTNYGATANTAGKLGTAYDFETADSDNISIGNISAMIPTANVTFNAWYKPESFANYKTILGTNTNGYGFNLNSVGALGFSKIGVSGATSTDNLGSAGGAFRMISVTYNGTHAIFYINGTVDSGGPKAYAETFSQLDFFIGARDGASNFADGVIDEVGIWNRALNATEISSLWNSSNGYTFDFSSTTGSGNATYTLNAPVNYYNSSNQTVIFNISAYDDAGIKNVTLYIDNVANETNTSGVNGTYIFTKGPYTANHTWYVLIYDTNNQSNTSSIQNFYIDNEAPAFVPAISNQSIIDNSSFSYDINATDNYVGVSKYWINYTQNLSINDTTGLLTNITPLETLLYAINISVNDTLGNTNTSIFYLNYSYVADTTAPTYSQNSTNSTLVSTLISHRLLWADNKALSGFIFSFDNGSGTFANDTWTAMDASNWTNVSKVANSTASTTISWQVYANDSSNNWNVSSFSYVTTSPAPEGGSSSGGGGGNSGGVTYVFNDTTQTWELVDTSLPASNESEEQEEIENIDDLVESAKDGSLFKSPIFWVVTIVLLVALAGSTGRRRK